jgi:AraC family transcriptional regulator, transcriptional activator FtrA
MAYIVKITPKRTVKINRQTRLANNLVVVLAYDGVNAFELGTAVEVFGLPNMGPDWYRVVVRAERTGVPLAASGGVKIMADVGLSFLRQAGTIVVPGWQDIDAPPPDALLNALRRAHARGVRIASICSGVFILAAAGLLEGRRVAAHWANAEALSLRYPSLRVDPDVLYVDDGEILSSAGRASGLDLCVHIVRRDFGSEVANDVARRMVIPAHREGGQAQFTPNPVWTGSEPLRELRVWVQKHLDRKITIATLAAKARMSRRIFIRRFEEATGLSPGEWVLQERTARARNLLESTDMSIEQVAAAVGFASEMRYAITSVPALTPARPAIGSNFGR